MKSQAETAGRLSASTGAQPQKGTVLRDLELELPDGTHRLLSAVRGQANLVMIFTAGHDVRPFLSGLLSLNRALKENSAAVLVISLGSDCAPVAELRPDLLSISIDLSGAIHRALGATDPAHTPVPTVYVTDRFGEVFAAFRAAETAALPAAQEIVRWLEFINYQCEECSPPEWPE